MLRETNYREGRKQDTPPGTGGHGELRDQKPLTSRRTEAQAPNKKNGERKGFTLFLRRRRELQRKIFRIPGKHKGKDGRRKHRNPVGAVASRETVTLIQIIHKSTVLRRESKKKKRAKKTIPQLRGVQAANERLKKKLP